MELWVPVLVIVDHHNSVKSLVVRLVSQGRFNRGFEDGRQLLMRSFPNSGLSCSLATVQSDESNSAGGVGGFSSGDLDDDGSFPC